jgi:hypothetical protein
LPAEVTRYTVHQQLAGFGLGAQQFEIYASAVLQTVGRREYIRRFGTVQVQRVELPGTLHSVNSVPTLNTTQNSAAASVRTVLR